MTREEFYGIRHFLEKTQHDMARLLGTSLKSVQSFEQGWRNIPMHIERQTLFLLHMKKIPEKRYEPCWAIEECPVETRQNCPAWEFRAGHICWFINGTICHGRTQENWGKKMAICRQCRVFQTMMPMGTVAATGCH
jgi:DNA-binding XRE family transcriptional regulator